MTDFSNKIIGVVIALLLAGILLPIGLAEIEVFTSSNSTIETLVTTVLPVMAVLSIVLLFINKQRNS